jgi:dTMP kinase
MQQVNKPYEGFFITIEGGDGSGKTTLSDRLMQMLQSKGYSVLRTREPGGTPLSEHLREILLNTDGKFEIAPKTELLLYLAARAQNVEERIKPALHEGQIVICERFNDSTTVYQGCGRNLGMQFVEEICTRLFDGPDFTLFLDVDPEEGMQRVKLGRNEKYDRLELEKLQFHKEVRQGYLHLADEHPNRIVILDASQSQEQVFQEAWKALEPRLMLRAQPSK